MISHFRYDNGNLLHVKACGRKKAGSIAGYKMRNGYIMIGFNKKRELAHRLIWKYHYGNIPDGMEIDHINGIRYDNRIENLRLVSKSENQKNRQIDIRNKSGYTGVFWYKAKQKWTVKISSKIIGYFDSFAKAVVVRKAAEAIYGYHSNHGRKRCLVL